MKKLFSFLFLLPFSVSLLYGQYTAENATVTALGTTPSMLSAPNIYTNDVLPGTSTTISAGDNKAIYYDALDYQGNPTRVYARIRIPAGASAANPVPGIVLVHGGGQSANAGWVNQWHNRGYAAISIAVEGQTDQNNNPDPFWNTHNMPGPKNQPIYNDTNVTPITNQWMYHAVADTILANSLLRDLPFVDANKVGVMGISWGGVITSTTIGIDTRFAFAVPTYGCGHLFDASNAYGAQTEDDELYKQVWDPMLRLQNATMPVMWYSWPGDQFPMDSLAYSYHKQGGPRMVSLVPRMQHGRGFVLFRPEAYDFADSVVNTGAPWASQQSVNVVGNTATVVFNSTKDLEFARLVYTDDYDEINSGVGVNQTWNEVTLAAPVESPSGTYTITATIPATAKAWYVNAYVDSNDPTGNQIDDMPDPYNSTDWLVVRKNQDTVISSDYQEVIEVTTNPVTSLDIIHNIGDTTTNGNVLLSYDYPHNIEITGLTVSGGTHPSAFSVITPSAPYTINADPVLGTSTSVTVQFSNAVAGLSGGQTATAFLNIEYENLNGTTDVKQILLQATTPSTCDTITYSTTSNWTSQTVDCCDDVIINNNAVVNLDGPAAACVEVLTVNDAASPTTGSLLINQNVVLTVGTGINLGAGSGTGTLSQSTGVVNTPSLVLNSNNSGNGSFYSHTGGTLNLLGAAVLQVNANSEFILNGGTVAKNISGNSENSLGSNTATGTIKIQSGSLLFSGGVAADGIIQYSPIEISGGTVDIDGQLLPNGEIKVIGTSASINADFFNCLGGADLLFELGASGVSPINVTNWCFLSLSTIAIDGTNYTGGAATIPLVNCGSLLSEAVVGNISFIGFAANLELQVVQDGNGADLVITEIPPYNAWTAAAGLTGTAAGFDQDPDGDGYDNLHEFAFGGDPAVSDATVAPASFDGTTFSITRRTASVAGLVYTFEGTDDLSDNTWDEVMNVTELVVGTSGDMETLQITKPTGWTTDTMYFLRMKVGLAP